MKVLHVMSTYLPAYSRGGPIHAVHELCKTLVKKGVDITVFTTTVDLAKDSDIRTNGPQYIDGVKVFYFSVVKPMGFYCYSRSLSRAVKKHVRQFDIVHIHSVYLHPGWVTAYWCRKHKIPYIVNTFGALNMDMVGRSIKKKLYISLFEKININGAKAVHAASEHEKNQIEAFGFKSPVVVIPRSVNIDCYRKAKADDYLIRKHPVLKDKKIVLFLGRIHQKKGFDLLIPAFKKIIDKRDDTYLVVAGPGKEGYVRKVKDLARKSGIMKNAVFTGMLLGEAKLSAFYNSDIFVLPSHGENFGIACLEAMASGLPVVITGRVGLYPDVKEYGAGLVTECDSGQVADGILTLLNNENMRVTMARNGIRLAEDRFSSDKEAEKMIALYDRILTT